MFKKIIGIFNNLEEQEKNPKQYDEFKTRIARAFLTRIDKNRDQFCLSEKNTFGIEDTIMRLTYTIGFGYIKVSFTTKEYNPSGKDPLIKYHSVRITNYDIGEEMFFAFRNAFNYFFEEARNKKLDEETAETYKIIDGKLSIRGF